MKIVGIVSEYNPLHWGHLHQMEEIRRCLGEDTYVICIMSGNFVQRGDFAVYDKWSRAQAAVLCGADLVIELPLPYVLSSAEHFAMGAVSLLDLTGVVTHLSFGSESGSIEDLYNIARVLNADAGVIGEKMKSGKPYAAVCQDLVSETLGQRSGVALKSPNNILGIEYIRSILRLSSNIEPLTVARTGAGHDSLAPGGDFASAAYIRRLMRAGDSIKGLIPPKALDVFAAENQAGRGPVFMEDAQQALLALLRAMDSSAFSQIADISEGIENRLMRAVSSEVSISAIADKVKTKRYPESRIRRMLLSACLGIKDGDRQKGPPYIRILASGDRGRGIIRAMTQNSCIPVVTKPSKIKKLSDGAQTMFALETRATDLYVLACTNQEYRKAGREWRQGPFIESLGNQNQQVTDE